MTDKYIRNGKYINSDLIIITKFFEHDARIIMGYCKSKNEYVAISDYKFDDVVTHTGREIYCSDNPIVAWNMYSEMVDIHMRKRIGDFLESQGKNRWTGDVYNDD